MTAPLSIEDARRLVQDAVGPKVAAENLTPEARFEDLGLTSLDLTEVLFAVEEHLGLELEPIAEKDPATLGELLEQVNAMAARAAKGVTA